MVATTATGIPSIRGTTSTRTRSAGFLAQGGGRKMPSADVKRASSAKWQTVKPPAARRPLSASYSTGPPPLATALERAGLGHYARKLCNECVQARSLRTLARSAPHPPACARRAWCLRRASRLSCSTVRQLLALNRPQLDALFDQLRPLPGHRVLLQKFLADQRMEAMKAAADRETGAASADSSDAVATPAQRREWSSVRRSLLDASVAAKRGRDGPIAHLIEQQPLHWGTAKGPAPLAQVSGHAMIAALQPCRRRYTVDGRLSHCVSPSDLLSTLAPLTCTRLRRPTFAERACSRWAIVA